MIVSIFIKPVKSELPTIKILTSIILTLSDDKTETQNQDLPHFYWHFDILYYFSNCLDMNLTFDSQQSKFQK